MGWQVGGWEGGGVGMDGTTLQIPAMQSLVSDFPWRRHERIDLSFGFVTHPSLLLLFFKFYMHWLPSVFFLCFFFFFFFFFLFLFWGGFFPSAASNADT